VVDGARLENVHLPSPPGTLAGPNSLHPPPLAPSSPWMRSSSFDLLLQDSGRNVYAAAREVRPPRHGIPGRSAVGKPCATCHGTRTTANSMVSNNICGSQPFHVGPQNEGTLSCRLFKTFPPSGLRLFKTYPPLGASFSKPPPLSPDRAIDVSGSGPRPGPEGACEWRIRRSLG
jgi:hypothetical protein